MLGGVTEFAVAGDFGTDVFRRVDESNQRRYRYECIATVSDTDGAVQVYHDHARRHPQTVHKAVDRWREAQFLKHPFALGDPASYPGAVDIGSPLGLFVYVDFFRMWQIADQEICRMLGLAQAGTLSTGPEISTVLRLLLDFNRIRHAQPMIVAFLPALKDAALAGKDDKWQNVGFSLRMIGDLQFRAGLPAEALAAYELALSLGDNPHRRGLAIRAASAAQDRDAVQKHLAAYTERWPLPEVLAEIGRAIARTPAGD